MFAPDASAPSLSWVFAPASLGMIWLAGHCAARPFPSPARLATDFLAGLLILFFSALVCDATGLRITGVSLALGLGLAALAGLLLARRRGVPAPRLRLPSSSLRGGFALAREAWWALPCLLSLCSVFVRGVVDPLAGWDNLWRWNHLALIVHDTGSLAAYPPVSVADYQVYPWCDGIPPLVALLNSWIYFFSGSTHGGLVAFRLALELILTGLLSWRIASGLWGPLGARVTVLALSGCALFLASISIAQETGLAGCALLVAALAALDYHRTGALSSALWLAASVSAAALCRDYNLLFAPLALVLLVMVRAPLRHVAVAGAALLVLIGPWYARNWAATGNPLFAHDLLGLFPVPAYHAYLMEEIRRFWHPSNTPGFAAALGSTLAAGAGGTLLVAASALRVGRPGPAGLILGVFALGSAALWAWSVPSTAGGVVYSLRVLGPALPLLAIAAGAWACVPRRGMLLGAALLGLLAVDAARRHWIFFLDPTAPPLPYAWNTWHPTDRIHARFSREKLWAALAASAGDEAIVADNPGYTVHGARSDIVITPLASPRLRALDANADETRSADELAAALRADGVRFLVLAQDTRFARESHARHPALARMLELPPVGTYEGLWVYDLRLMAKGANGFTPSP